MLKATVNNGPEQLWLEQKVAETRAMDGDVRALDILLGRGLGPISPSCRLHLIVFIVQELIVHIILCHHWAGRGAGRGLWVRSPRTGANQGEEQGVQKAKGKKDTSDRRARKTKQNSERYQSGAGFHHFPLPRPSYFP